MGILGVAWILLCPFYFLPRPLGTTLPGVPATRMIPGICTLVFPGEVSCPELLGCCPERQLGVGTTPWDKCHATGLGYLPCASALGLLTQSCATPWSFHLPEGVSAPNFQLTWLCQTPSWVSPVAGSISFPACRRSSWSFPFLSKPENMYMPEGLTEIQWCQ